MPGTKGRLGTCCGYLQEQMPWKEGGRCGHVTSWRYRVGKGSVRLWSLIVL